MTYTENMLLEKFENLVVKDCAIEIAKKNMKKGDKAYPFYKAFMELIEMPTDEPICYNIKEDDKLYPIFKAFEKFFDLTEVDWTDLEELKHQYTLFDLSTEPFSVFLETGEISINPEAFDNWDDESIDELFRLEARVLSRLFYIK